MPDVNERLDGVEQTLTTLTEHVKEQFTNVEEQFTKLRLLGEEDTAQIKVIAEVQAHHGTVHGAALQRIEAAIEPLKVLPEAFRTVFMDHARRITALEEANRQRTPDA
jgi:hypothetical protein